MVVAYILNSTYVLRGARHSQGFEVPRKSGSGIFVCVWHENK